MVTKKPSERDNQRTVAHLAETISDNLAHATRHISAAARATDPQSKAFNNEHAVHHLASAREHARKLQDHVKKHPAVKKEIDDLNKAKPA